MISFSGSFHVQLAPFLAFILGGGVGLYVSLGARNPSPAILVASLLLPFATFYAITSYLLNLTLAVFLVTAVAYSFATAAMIVPALAEFDFAMGRSTAAEESAFYFLDCRANIAGLDAAAGRDGRTDRPICLLLRQ